MPLIYFYQLYIDRVWKKELFRKEKSNLPAIGSKNLRNFMIGAKSELLGTKSNKIKSNISKEETEALETLIKLL